VRAVTEKTVVSAAFFALAAPLFYAAGLVTGNHISAPWLATEWDAKVPLVPVAIWPYLSWYLAPLLLLGAPRNHFRRSVLAIALAFASCIIVFVILPISIGRPALAGTNTSERLLLLAYQYDPPWNVFPSFHAALCAILWKPGFSGLWTRLVMAVWMLIICVACVLTKQHNLLDIVAGLLVGVLSLAAANAAFNRLQTNARGIFDTDSRVSAGGLQ